MRSGSENVKTSFYQSLKLFHFLHMGIPLQEEHRVPIHHCPVDLVLFVCQDTCSVVFRVSKWLFALCNIVVINWLNKQMNDQMMSQQRLGPFEMHTKPVSTRGPPLVPYNKVCQIILFAFFFFFFFNHHQQHHLQPYFYCFYYYYYCYCILSLLTSLSSS